jgi:integrase
MASLVCRCKTYYVQWRVGGKIKRRSLETTSKQIAREKLRQFESAQFKGDDAPGPTRTRLPDILARYAEHVRATKTPKSAQVDIYYLRQIFGPVCPALAINSRRASLRAMKRPPKPGQDRRFKMAAIEVDYIEQVTTADISNFIDTHFKSRGLQPKTANRYREVVSRLFSWAMTEQDVKMPGDVNPVAKVAKYKESAPDIQFLTLDEIDTQLKALAHDKLLQTLVATYIYAGLRREEALWLTMDDVDFNSGPFGIIRIRAKKIDGQSWQPKTKSNRAVPISSTLRRYLDDHVPRVTPQRWFFPSPKGFLYDPDNFSRDLRNANARAGLSWTCLDFRHTFGSHLATKGESLYKISALMGNSPEICRRHYAALIPDALADCVEFGFAGDVKPETRYPRVWRPQQNAG